MPEIAGQEITEQALNECQELLISAKVEADRNAHLQGRLTSVSILNMPAMEDPSLRRIEIVCHRTGHLNIEWDRLYVIPTDKSLPWLLVGPSGRAAFQTTRETRFPIEFSRYLLSFSQEITPEMVAVVFGPAPPIAPELRVASGLDATLRFIKGPNLKVKVWATDPKLYGCTLELQFRSKAQPERVFSTVGYWNK